MEAIPKTKRTFGRFLFPQQPGGKSDKFNATLLAQSVCNLKSYDSRPIILRPLSSVFIRGDLKSSQDSLYMLTYISAFTLGNEV